METAAITDATGVDDMVYVLNTGTMYNQFGSVCRTVGAIGYLGVLCDAIRK